MPKKGLHLGSEVGCRFCSKTESDRWYFNDICRSCRRKQLRDTQAIVKTREIRLLNKKSPKCWDCGETESKRWYKDSTQCQKCKNLEYRTKNEKQIKEQKAKYNKANREKINEYKKDYRKRTGKHRFLQSKRKGQKLKALPFWVNKTELENVYKNCPKNMTVDHIIPLQNSLVCGLHVPSNLQYLSISDNSKKHNKFDLTYANESWRL